MFATDLMISFREMTMSLAMAISMSKSAQTRILLSCSDIPVIPGMDIARSSFDKWIHATSCILQNNGPVKWKA